MQQLYSNKLSNGDIEIHACIDESDYAATFSALFAGIREIDGRKCAVFKNVLIHHLKPLPIADGVMHTQSVEILFVPTKNVLYFLYQQWYAYDIEDELAYTGYGISQSYERSEEE